MSTSSHTKRIFSHQDNMIYPNTRLLEVNLQLILDAHTKRLLRYGNHTMRQSLRLYPETLLKWLPMSGRFGPK
jgi:hypothetical protein